MNRTPDALAITIIRRGTTTTHVIDTTDGIRAADVPEALRAVLRDGERTETILAFAAAGFEAGAYRIIDGPAHYRGRWPTDAIGHALVSYADNEWDHGHCMWCRREVGTAKMIARHLADCAEALNSSGLGH